MLCPHISLSRATPLGKSRYQTSEFLNTLEFTTELRTHVLGARRLSLSSWAKGYMYFKMIRTFLMGPYPPMAPASRPEVGPARPEAGPSRPEAGLVYRGTSLVRNRHPVGPYSGTMPRLLWWS